ncbi:5920_t:CDS:10 [Racocetra fulgida]|uniref:ATP-dependent DNA helicase II subunit 1 n=1 Tax=Racocetra fulgida TaxID=60492 RepID=A0A9N8VSZ6_9GLOM|nr:5920_t:CDS:10 [Racocetra fulgida]
MSSTATISSSSSVANESNAGDFELEEVEEVEKQVISDHTFVDAVLFVIDCSPSMMSGDDSPFKSAIRCASSVMMNKIITSNDYDLMGVVLFGTEKSQNALEKMHIYVLQPIDLPDIHRIIELNDIVSGQIDFSQEYGNTDNEVPLGDDTAQELMPEDMKLCFSYGGEKQYEGSRRTFAALHKKMIEKDKIAICAAKIRNGTPFTFVALKAQPEILDENGLQIQPPGMNMISLPFADDMRPVPVHAEISPDLNRFFNVLQDMALNKDIEPETNDATLPKYNAINKVFNEEAKTQSQETLPSQTDSESVGSYRASSFKGSRSMASSQGSQADISTLYESGKATVVQLKDFLNSVGIKPAKKKDDLVKQIKFWVRLDVDHDP